MDLVESFAPRTNEVVVSVMRVNGDGDEVVDGDVVGLLDDLPVGPVVPSRWGVDLDVTWYPEGVVVTPSADGVEPAVLKGDVEVLIDLWGIGFKG